MMEKETAKKHHKKIATSKSLDRILPKMSTQKIMSPDSFVYKRAESTDDGISTPKPTRYNPLHSPSPHQVRFSTPANNNSSTPLMLENRLDSGLKESVGGDIYNRDSGPSNSSLNMTMATPAPPRSSLLMSGIHQSSSFKSQGGFSSYHQSPGLYDNVEDDLSEQHLSKWVVCIHGGNNLDEKTVIARFDQYGSIVATHTSSSSFSSEEEEIEEETNNNESAEVAAAASSPTDNTKNHGNWICFKYKSMLEAEMAVKQDGTFHPPIRHDHDSILLYSDENVLNRQETSGLVLLSVRKLTPELVRQLNVDIYATGGSHTSALMGVSDGERDRGYLMSPKWANQDECVLLSDKQGSMGMSRARANNGSVQGVVPMIIERLLKWIFMWEY